MAKRKITKTVKANKTKPAKAPKKPRTKAKDRHVARQPALPSMGQVRNGKLDRLCENIGEARERKNTAVTDEEGDSQAALRVMQSASIEHYTHAGVELIRRHGADKLSIKLLKDKTAEGRTPADAAADLAGDNDEQDADHGDNDEIIDEAVL